MFSFFNKQGSKREFGYRPRFYDPDKERREARRNKINQSTEGSKDRLRFRFDEMRSSTRGSNSFRSSSTFRLAIILVALLVLTYLGLLYWIPSFMESVFPETKETYEILK